MSSKEKKFIVDVLVVPSKLETMISGTRIRTEKRTVFGKSQSEALINAGIK